jgi:Protein of unknown function (DUF642)
MKTFIGIVLAGVFCISSVGAGAGNLIVNGNFDNDIAAGTCIPTATYGAGTATVSGWKILDGLEVQILAGACSGVYPVIGGHFVDLTSGSAAVLYQSVATKVGTVYQLSFYFGGNPVWCVTPPGVSGIPNDGPLKAMQLYVNSVFIQTYTVNSAVACADLGPQWVLGTYVFVATSTSTTISFHSLNGAVTGDPNGETGPEASSNWGPLLSGVSMVALSAAQ